MNRLVLSVVLLSISASSWWDKISLHDRPVRVILVGPRPHSLLYKHQDCAKFNQGYNLHS